MHQTLDSRSPMLPSLDAGRFVAALLVTMFHSTFTVLNFGGAAPLRGAFRGGHAGVEYFFVLSGFIIWYAHRRDLGQPGSIPGYARKRATRILPMLWLVLVPWGVFRIVFAAEITNAPTGPATLALDMLLLPHPGPLVLGVTWTLQRELVFYVLFVTALVNRRAGMIVLGAWQAAVLVVAVLNVPLDAYGLAVFELSNLGFGVGLTIAIWGHRLRLSRPMLLAVAGALAFAAVLVLEHRLGGPLAAEYRPLGRGGSLLYIAATALCLVGLIAQDQTGTLRKSRLVAALGGSSYVLYLIHGPIGSLLVRALRPLHLPSEALFLALTFVPVLAALALHLWVERPILAALRPVRRVERAAPDKVLAKAGDAR